MTDYARITANFEVSENSDYGEPYIDPPKWVAELTPDEGFFERVDAETTGVTISTSKLSTCTVLAIRNRDTTNYVTLVWRGAGGGANDMTVRIPAGGMLYLQDITAATDPTLTADTATCKCEVFYAGT